MRNSKWIYYVFIRELNAKRIASPVVNWMCITLSWTLIMKWDYCNSREKDQSE